MDTKCHNSSSVGTPKQTRVQPGWYLLMLLEAAARRRRLSTPPTSTSTSSHVSAATQHADAGFSSSLVDLFHKHCASATTQPHRPGLAPAIWQSNPSLLLLAAEMFSRNCVVCVRSVCVCVGGERGGTGGCKMLTLKNEKRQVSGRARGRYTTLANEVRRL